MSPTELLAAMQKRCCCKQVIDRVMRLNPNGTDPEAWPRGWHRRPSPFLLRGLLSRPQVVRKFGREAWDKMPAVGLVRVGGKRRLARREAVEDHLWAIPADDPVRALPIGARR